MRYALIDGPRCAIRHRPPTPDPSPPQAEGGERAVPITLRLLLPRGNLIGE
jgi:hypothetical protein